MRDPVISFDGVPTGIVPGAAHIDRMKGYKII
jgi:hypothetical protein